MLRWLTEGRLQIADCMSLWEVRGGVGWGSFSPKYRAECRMQRGGRGNLALGNVLEAWGLRERFARRMRMQMPSLSGFRHLRFQIADYRRAAARSLLARVRLQIADCRL